MIVVDRALAELEARNAPLRVAMIGAGFMGRGIARQIIRHVPGMRLVAIYNRSLEGARRAYVEAGIDDPQAVDTTAELESSVGAGRPAITDDPYIVCEAGPIDVIIEVTGSVEFAARVVLRAIQSGKHVVAMNAELDGTIGPILHHHAQRAGVVLTNADGDQPGVIMNLFRFVKGIGVQPILCGNIKGLHDPYRNPTTQEQFARRWKQKPHMVTAFADGTKISFEQAIVANATGMRVSRRGMCGPTVQAGTHVRETIGLLPVEQARERGGLVDYVVGAEPSPGVFVVGVHDDPVQRHYLHLYKLGEGPYYCFYTPYHLCHLEVPTSVARAALFRDPTIAPEAGPCVDVVATAKRDLRAGEILDGIGWYMTYGQAENADVVWRDGLLPMGLADGARLRRDIERDRVLTRDDVELPPGRLADQLRAEQDEMFHRNADAQPLEAAR